MSDGANQTTASAHIRDDVPPGLPALALGSVGVVYGDIGTSPLYAFREAAIAASGDQVVSRGVVLGVLSADRLGTHHNGHTQIRSYPAAGRQQWGGRHAVAHCAGDPCTWAAYGFRFHCWRDRSLDVPGRLGDYAGDFGAFSSGGAQDSQALLSASSLCRSRSSF